MLSSVAQFNSYQELFGFIRYAMFPGGINKIVPELRDEFVKDFIERYTFYLNISMEKPFFISNPLVIIGEK